MSDDYGPFSGKLSRDEFERRVQEKIQEFQGLLTREGAVSIIASELGMSPVRKPKDVSIKIADIQEGMTNIDLLGKVTRLSEVKQFTKRTTGESGRVMSVVLADESGSVRVSLWDEQTEVGSALSIGDAVRLSGGFAKKGFNDAVELTLTRRGAIEKTSADIDVPVAREEHVAVADLAEGMANICLTGVVAGVSDVREYERSGRTFKVCSLFVRDATGQVRVSLWNAHAEATRDLSVGDAVRLSGCYARMGFGGVEVQTNAYSRLEIRPDVSGLDLPDVGAFVPLGELSADHQFCSVRGTVAALFEPRTFSRDDGSTGTVGSMELQDESGSVRVSLWDEQADALATLAPGMTVVLEGCSAREGLEGIELRLGKQSRLTYHIPDEASCAIPPSGLARVLEAKDGAIKALSRTGSFVIITPADDYVPGDLVRYTGTVEGDAVKAVSVARATDPYPSLEELLEPPERPLGSLSAGDVARVRGIVRAASTVKGCTLIRLDDGSGVVTGYTTGSCQPGQQCAAQASAFDNGGVVEVVARDIAPLDMEREAYRFLAVIGEE